MSVSFRIEETFFLVEFSLLKQYPESQLYKVAVEAWEEDPEQYVDTFQGISHINFPYILQFLRDREVTLPANVFQDTASFETFLTQLGHLGPWHTLDLTKITVSTLPHTCSSHSFTTNTSTDNSKVTSYSNTLLSTPGRLPSTDPHEHPGKIKDMNSDATILEHLSLFEPLLPVTQYQPHEKEIQEDIPLRNTVTVPFLVGKSPRARYEVSSSLLWNKYRHSLLVQQVERNKNTFHANMIPPHTSSDANVVFVEHDDPMIFRHVLAYLRSSEQQPVFVTDEETKNRLIQELNRLDIVNKDVLGVYVDNKLLDTKLIYNFLHIDVLAVDVAREIIAKHIQGLTFAITFNDGDLGSRKLTQGTTFTNWKRLYEGDKKLLRKCNSILKRFGLAIDHVTKCEHDTRLFKNFNVTLSSVDLHPESSCAWTDVVKTNVGGIDYSISRDLFEKFFKQQAVPFSSDGTFFLEGDGMSFQYILKYLNDGYVYLPLSESKHFLVHEMKRLHINPIDMDCIDYDIPGIHRSSSVSSFLKEDAPAVIIAGQSLSAYLMNHDTDSCYVRGFDYGNFSEKRMHDTNNVLKAFGIQIAGNTTRSGVVKIIGLTETKENDGIGLPPQ